MIDDDTIEDAEKRLSPGIFSVLLAFSLFAIVLLLHFLGDSEIPIVEEQFERLYENNLLSSIRLSDNSLYCQLVNPVWIDNMGRRILTDKVFVDPIEAVSMERIEAWKSAGITVHFESEKRGIKKQSGVLLIASLLGIGVWHLWSQVKQDRQGSGSPRRRLQELEDQLKTGKITKEEYQKQAEPIWAEM